MPAFPVDIIVFGLPTCHDVADTDNTVSTLTLTIALPKADSVFYADDPICGVEANELVTGVLCCDKVVS
jgi:hypothetical protein